MADGDMCVVFADTHMGVLYVCISVTCTYYSPPLFPFIRVSSLLLSFYVLLIFIALCSEYSLSGLAELPEIN